MCITSNFCITISGGERMQDTFSFGGCVFLSNFSSCSTFRLFSSRVVTADCHSPALLIPCMFQPQFYFNLIIIYHICKPSFGLSSISSSWRFHLHHVSNFWNMKKKTAKDFAFEITIEEIKLHVVNNMLNSCLIYRFFAFKVNICCYLKLLRYFRALDT